MFSLILHKNYQQASRADKSRQPASAPKPQREHRNVVFLPKRLCRGRNLVGRLLAHATRAIESKQFPFAVARFQHAVGKQRDRVFRIQLQRRFHIFRRADNPQRQAGFDRNFGAIAIGREMTCVGNGDFSVRENARAEACDKSALLRLQ